MRRALPAIVLLAVMGTAACAAQHDPVVATAASAAPKAGAPSADDDSQRTGLKYSQCMRDQGLSWFPDPQPDGGMKVQVPEGTDRAKMDKADRACQKYQPGGGPGHPIPAADLAKVRQVSQCIRDHGFPQWPDPDANGRVTVDSQKSDVKPDDPKFQQAQQECSRYAPSRPARAGS